MNVATRSILVAQPDTPDWSMLVDVREAARLLGVNADHLSRRCRTDLSGRGLAFYLKPPGGGKARWFVHRSYNLKLAPGAAGRSYRAPDLSCYTERQQQAAWQRAACVDTFNEYRVDRTDNQHDWLPGLIHELGQRFPDLSISTPSLRRWHRSYRSPIDILKLIDNRGGNTRGVADPAAWKALRDLYLDDRQPSLRSCWSRVKDLARQQDWTWCSYKSCQRQLNDRIAPDIQTRHREPSKWRGSLSPYIAQDKEAWTAGHCWVGDHKQMDLWCLFGGKLIRPWLTAWLDWRTRRVTGWVISESPNSSTILAALRHGLMDEANHGGPSVVWIDNGKDYDCYAFHGQTKQQRLGKMNITVNEPQAAGLFKMLSIEPHFSLAYNPNGKARTERWFRSIEDFFKSLPTYAGRSTDTKPESLVRILNNRRLIPTFEHIRERFAKYVQGYNRRSDHRIDDLVEDAVRLSPDDAMARWCFSRRVMADPGALDLLMQQWHKPVTVTRNGIMINVAGRNLSYGHFDPALTPFKALRKKDRALLNVSFDPHDLGTIRVFDEQWRFVCETAMNGVGGRHGTDAISRRHVADLNRAKAKYSKSMSFIREHRHQEYLTDSELLADAALPDETPPTPTADRSMKLIQTPLDGQSKAVQKDRLRKVVGAEHLDDNPLFTGGLESLRELASARCAGIDDTESLIFDTEVDPSETLGASSDTDERDDRHILDDLL